MKRTALVLLLVVSGAVTAQTVSRPDVIVGSLPSVVNYGVSGSETAFAVGTTSCNIGSTPLIWIANNNRHPVIGQNLYRLKNDRFEMLGMSWLKHGFTALQQNLCSPCTANPNGSALGVGCSDPYSAGLNGSQGGLGPRSEVNATTGGFPYPWTNFTPPIANPSMDKRLRVQTVDVDPAFNSGARYFFEGQYIHPDDAAQNNDDNNSSYREATIAGPSAGFNVNWVGNTVRQQPAIMAWGTIDPQVTTQIVDVPGDGRYIMAWKSFPSPISVGLTRYEVALHNLNSDRSAGGVSFDFPCGAITRLPGFNDVDYHSGEELVYTNTDWTATATATALSYTNDAPFSTNPNANALRWGTMYNFWFDTDTAPSTATITLFKPGTPTTVTVPMGSAGGPALPEYQTNGFVMRMAVDNVLGTPTAPTIVTKNRNQQGILAMSSFGTGQPWEMIYGARPLIPRSACGLQTSDAQVINIDLTDPFVGLWFNAFQSPPFQSFSLPFSVPVSGTISIQSAILNPGAPSGLSLSQATQIDIL